jgi:HTH-type transcriptional regulator / antitoxin HigA
MTKTSGKTAAHRTQKTVGLKRIDGRKYARLLAATLPTVIETEEQNDRMLSVIERLMRKGEDLTPEEETLLNLLSHLIHDFEQRYYRPEEATPLEVLTELMLANGLKQADLLPIFGSRGIVSEVVNGKRSISKAHAKALAEFFNVPADVFL